MKYIKIIIPLMLFAFTAFSQNTLTVLSWSMGFSTGKTSEYVGKPSFSGFSIEGHRFMKPNVSVGLITGWNIMNEKTNESVSINNTTLTGEQGRYLNIIPLLFSASYYIRKNSSATFVPFIRGNIGTYYIMQRFDVGVYTLNNDNWHFGLSPELGFMVKASNKINIIASGRYNYAMDSGTRLSGDEKNDYSFLNANIGLTISY